MGSSNEDTLNPRSQLALTCFEELLDCPVADVASECDRIARLGPERSVDAEEEELRSAAASDHHLGAAGATAEEGGRGKGGVDVFGQTHPAITADVVECMNCGRPVVSGFFAQHLEKCMGKVGSNNEAKVDVDRKTGKEVAHLLSKLEKEGMKIDAKVASILYDGLAKIEAEAVREKNKKSKGVVPQLLHIVGTMAIGFFFGVEVYGYAFRVVNAKRRPWF